MAAAGVIADFELPRELEAAEPPEARGLRRDEVRLLVSDIERDSIEHARFTDLPRWLSPGDLLVVNTSGTLNAAVSGDGPATGEVVRDAFVDATCPAASGPSKCGSRARVASLPYHHALAGMTFALPADGTITLAGAVSARRSDRRSHRACGSRRCSFRAPSSRISTSMAFRFDTAT